MARLPFQVLVYLYRPLPGGEFEYALFQRADHGCWQAIAGGGESIASADETPLEAARRETREETGLAPEAPFIQLQTVEPIPVTEFSARANWRPDLYVIPQYCFGVQAPAAELRLSHEHITYCWLPFPEACRLLKFDGNRTALWELDCRLRGLDARRAPPPPGSG